MEQLVKDEAQKHLANQMREARVQRQKQVRQQALAWTEATRRKFEETKEREIKGLATAVTGQVQSAAIKNIEELTLRNDLAMAEIGMAHRAAAGYQNVERLKSLKRLKNDEVATNRGSAAMMRHLKQKEAERSRNTAILRRKEEVRKAEDRLSKDLVSRMPLKVSNPNIDPKVKLGPPEYQQSIAKTLKVASTTTTGDKPAQSSRPATTQNAVKAKIKRSKTPQRARSASLLPSSSSDLLLESKRKQKSKDGLLSRMVRIKTTSPGKAGLNFETDGVRDDFSTVQDLYGTGYTLRSKYQNAATGSPLHVPSPIQSNVRYFDATIPKGEVKYVAPPGLAVKEARDSPDAWEKGRKTSEESLQHQRIKALKEEEIAQKAAERGKAAMKKAKLEKDILEVRNELLKEIDYQFLGTGSQKAILGLDDSDNKLEEVEKFQALHQNLSSDEFSAVESDEEFNFPSPRRSTVHHYDVKFDDQAVLTLKRKSTSDSQTEGKIKESSSTDSFGSYSTPSLHSIEDGVIENRKIKAQRSLESLGHDVDKASPHLKGKSEEISPRKIDEVDLDSRVKRKDRSTLDAIDSSALPRNKKKEVGGGSFSDDPTAGNSDDALNRKSSSHHVPGKTVKSRKPSGSKSAAGKDDSIPRRKKSGSSSELFEPVAASNSKDSLSSEGSYSPPSLHSSSEDKVAQKVKTSSSKKKKSKSKVEAPEYTSLSKDKRQRDEKVPHKKSGRSAPTEPPVDKIVEAPASQRKKNTQSKVRSTTSINSSKSSGVFQIHSQTDSSGSTVAEINLRTTTSEAFPSDKKAASLLELHNRAKEQEKLLQKSHSNSSSLSDIQGDNSRHSDQHSARSHSLIPSVPKTSSNQDGKSPKERNEFKKNLSQSSTPSSSHTDSDQSSALVNIKVKQIDDSSGSQTSRSRAPGTSSSASKSDESSALVNLKILEQSDSSTPSRSEKSSTTDYYSPPDGPFTSTPDGKLHPKSGFQRSSESKDLDSIKRRTLYYYLDKFLKRRPDSIEHLPVSSSSSSSVIRTDSDVLETESFPDVVGENTQRNDTHSTLKNSMYSSSDTNGTSNKGLSTLHEEESINLDRDSGTTIAETAVVAGIIAADKTTTSTGSDLSHEKDESSLRSEKSSGSLNGAEQVSSDSLTGLLRVLSNYQEIEKYQLDFGDVSHVQEQSTGRTSQHNTSGNHQSNAGHDSSRDSIPDASAILRRLMSRQQGDNNSSRSSGSSSPKSGPEREAKRVELLDDVTPIKLWETPPQTNQIGANDTEKLAAVFENLIDKWSNMRIEKPPWTPFSDSSQKEDNGE